MTFGGKKPIKTRPGYRFYRGIAAVALLLTSIPCQAGTDEIEELIIRAHPLSAENLAQSSVLLDNEELNRVVAASIGATLSSEPGIHAASFGQAASRPVIHGLGGTRVRVMEDRIDTMDASVTSADHATTVEPFIANSIEVLKGASTLLYGSGAIGGVVDVHTGRIPHANHGVTSGRAELRWSDNADFGTLAGRLDGGTNALLWHVDGFWRDADEYELPKSRGTVPGSQLQASGGAAGISKVGSWGLAGIAVSTLNAEYGLPGAGEDVNDLARPRLTMEQQRVDVELGFSNLENYFESVNVRIGVNDYAHQEIEPSGELGTAVANEAWEARVEANHKPLGGWRGAVGAQFSGREFSALGEEAFVPPVDSSSVGVFWVAEKAFDSFDIEGGLRIERVTHKPEIDSKQDFSGWSTAIGVIVPLTESTRFSAQFDVATRAPVPEELYSNGPHLATQSFEVGDRDIDNETVRALSLTLNHSSKFWEFSVSAYHYDFADFIYQADSTVLTDGLKRLQWRQSDASFSGIDVVVGRQIAETRSGKINASVLADSVRATIDRAGNDNLPRIPANRLGIKLEYAADRWRADLRSMWVADQDDVSTGETNTPGYTDLGAQVSHRRSLNDSVLELFLQGKNLTDANQRQHTSFVKDVAPLPGRSIEVGLRYEF